MADSIVGSLCRETEWIWRRLIHISNSQQRCNSPKLLKRLQVEFDKHILRCYEIIHIMQLLKNKCVNKSILTLFIDELLFRALSVSADEAVTSS